MAKPITKEKIKQVLDPGGYFSSNRAVSSMDPIEPTPMKISVEEIEVYDRNPRRAKNPEYDSILESLRANGQEEALTVTRRPGHDKFMIKRGGNTRLDIMKILYLEAGDVRFAQIECLFMPWTNESDCIVGHLNENTSQGRMTLIDKARGYREYKIEYEKEHGIENLGLRKLAEFLRTKGAQVNHRSLGIMNYALDVLEPAIPETMSRGLGKPQVEKLKRLDQTFQRLADAHQLYDDGTRDNQVSAEFFTLLSDHDGDEWDLDLVIHEFVQRIGGLIDNVSINRLKYDIDQCLIQDPWKVELISTMADEQLDSPRNGNVDLDDSQGNLSTVSNISNLKTSENPVNKPEKQNNPVKPTSQSSGVEERELSTNRPKGENHDKNIGTVSSDLPTTTEQRLEIPQLMLTAGGVDLKSMRSRIYMLALKFAQATRVHHCIVPWSHGYGYFMDLPKSKLNHIMTMDQESLQHIEYKFVTNKFSKDRDDAQKTFGWWLLWQTQGLLEFNENPVPGYQQMPESMMKNLINQVYDPLETGRYSQMMSGLFQIRLIAGGPTCIMDMAMAYSYITPVNMMKYVELLEARTQLMAYTEENNIDLWEVKS